MPLSYAEKAQIVDEVHAQAQKSLSAIVAEYRGLTVSEMTDLRSKARNAGVYLRVVRNTLTRRALKDTEFSCLDESLTGPLFIAFSEEAPSDAARLLKDYVKENDKLVIRAISLSGKVLEPSALESVAKLPTRDEAIARLMAVMKAPVEKFVRTLNEPHAKLVRTFAALKEEKSN